MATGPWRAARDLLLGRPPRVGQAAGAAPPRGRTALERRDGSRLALDHTMLAIQGPPGSGKTYTGARMVCALLAAGKRVGITATSHKVIGNLLKAVLKRPPSEGVVGPADPARRRRTRSSTTRE